MIGQTISHYRIVSKLGEGGMGVVYLAEDTLLGRQVAIKTIMETGTDAPRFRSRFLREARAVSALSHPHIATIHDYGETTNGQPYIVMELIKGETLSDLIHQSKLTLKRSLEIAISVAGALHEAHRHGIVHRDIKPSNIAINERGEVKVLDFGLAKQLELGQNSNASGKSPTQANTQTRDGVVVGTPMYVSPEQALGAPVDARSDLFSLGSVLYECISGHPAFPGVSTIDIFAKVLRDDTPPPSQFNSLIPAELDQLTLKVLAKEPDERYQTAAELITGLQTVEDSLKDPGSRYQVTQRVTLPRSRGLSTMSLIFTRPRIPVGYVVAGVVIFALLAVGAWFLTRPKPHQPTAEAKQFYERGVSALREGTYFKASINLKRAVAADGRFALAHARLAEALTELDNTVDAKDEMLKARRGVLDRIDMIYLDAIEATVTRDLPTAINAYDEIAKLKPGEVEAYLDLGRAFENHDEVDKAIEQYSRAAALDQNNPAPALRLGVLYGRRQDPARAKASFDKAETLYKESQNFEGLAEVSYQRGYLLNQTRAREAGTAAKQSLEVAKLAENTYQQVRALLLLSTIAYSLGDTAQAEQLATQALELARLKEMESLATQGLLDLGSALMMKGSYQESENYLKQARDLAERFKEKRNQAQANLLLGTLYIQQDHTDQGAPFIEQAVEFYRNGGYRREMSRCMMITGRAQLLRGDFDGAVRILDEQLQLAKQVEDPGQLASSQAFIAAVLARQDLYPQALLRHTESYESNKKIGDPLQAAFALVNRGDMLARLGRYDESVAALSELEPLLSQLSNDNLYKSIWTGYSFVIRAQMDLSQHRLAEARTQCQKVLALVSSNRESLREMEGQITGILGLIEVQAGNKGLGKKLCQKAIALANRGHESIDTRLMLAQALVEIGDPDGLAAALEAQGNSARMRRAESEWRASLLAARANDRLGNNEAMRAQLSRAKTSLASIQHDWGAETFNSYAARPDIKKLLEQLSTLANR
jgi:tetratricopeptide (TPR) repeat protein/predicted Ser/Thr protein kinase